MCCGGLTLAGCWCPPKLLYHCPPQLARAERRQYKAHRSITQRLLPQAKQTQFGEISLMPSKSGKDNDKQPQILEHLPPTSPSSPGLTFYSRFSLPLPPQQHRETKNGGCCEFITGVSAAPSSSAGEDSSASPCCRCGVLPTGESSLQTSPT